ncbi:MAG TPA: hypothetical protein VGD66_05520 [Allosphingosinicella sp.]
MTLQFMRGGRIDVKTLRSRLSREKLEETRFVRRRRQRDLIRGYRLRPFRLLRSAASGKKQQ